MAYHVTQEVETTLHISSASTPATACQEALKCTDRELSALEDDPRVYNYDLFDATITEYPTHENGTYHVTVVFTVTAAVYTDTQPNAIPTGKNTINDALDGLFDAQTPVGALAIQEAL